MSITPYDPADFEPSFDPANYSQSMGTYNSPKTFRFWCQKVLPLVYDDSLSYYELLNKVVDYLNKTMEDVNTAVQDVFDLNQSFDNLQQYTNNTFDEFKRVYNQLQDYVNTYFDSLDVQEEINNKLDDMVADGTFDTLLAPYMAHYQQELDVMKGRLTVLETNYQPGGTSADAELADIRTGYNGAIYPTAGDAVRGQVSDLNSAIKREANNTNADNGYAASEYNYLINASGNWTATGNGIHFIIPINPGDSIKVTANTSLASNIAFLKTYSAPQANTSASSMLSSIAGFTERIVITKHTAESYNAPSDAKYLYVLKEANGNNMLPVSILVNSYEMLAGIRKSFVGYKGLLTTNDLFENIVNPGIYGVATETASEISDSPSDYGGNLIVFRSSLTATVTQMYCSNQNDGSIYWRNGVESNWIKLPTEIELNGKLGYMRILTSSDTFANLTEIGIYGLSNSTATAIDDSPSDYGGTVVVLKATNYATITQVYFSSSGDGSIYWRNGVESNWIRIQEIKYTPYMEASEYFVHTCVNRPVSIDSNTGIFVFGDSIAASTTLSPLTWGEVIAEKFGIDTETHYHNHAVGGSMYVCKYNSELEIIHQVESVASAEWADCKLCFVAAGTNDASTRTSHYAASGSEIRTAIKEVIDTIKENAPNAHIVLITPIQRAQEEYNKEIPPIAGAICNVALQNGCSVINGFEFPFAVSTNDWVQDLTRGDGLHPTDTTKPIYAQCVLNALL